MNNNILGPRERQKLLSGRRDKLIDLLPDDWKVRTIRIAPEYDTKRGSDLMTNVRFKKSNDENLMNVWEQVIAEAKQEGDRTARRNKQAKSRAKIAFPV